MDLEHHLWAELKNAQWLEQPMFVGLSGGVDSVALLAALVRVKKTKLTACYVHHGEGPAYRDQAEVFCRQLCQQLGVTFFTRKHLGPALKNEEELRDFRRSVFAELITQIAASPDETVVTALAHHREDLLETRLLRLLRGTGPQGLTAMSPAKDQIFRPWLSKSKADLRLYLDQRGLTSCEDPSNQELEPLRNWLRQTWLPQLEQRQTGSVQSLARSLERIVEALAPASWPESLFQNEAGHEVLSRAVFLSLTRSEQMRALAELLQRKKQNFTHSQLEEVLKRLDKPEKEFIFTVGRVHWLINAQQIQVQDSR